MAKIKDMEILTQPKRQGYYVLGLIFLLLLVAFFWWNKSRSLSPSPMTDGEQIEQVEVTQVRPLPKGTMKLTTDKKSYQSGEQVILTISANTAGESIVGYDAVITTDDKVKMSSVKSLLPDFTTFRIVGTSLVGAQNLDSKIKTILKDQPIAEAIFVAEKPGELTFGLEFEPFSTKDSSLQNDQPKPEDVLGAVECAKITIVGDPKVVNQEN